MTPKNYLKFYIIGILCLAIAGGIGCYYFLSSASADTPTTKNKPPANKTPQKESSATSVAAQNTHDSSAAPESPMTSLTLQNTLLPLAIVISIVVYVIAQNSNQPGPHKNPLVPQNNKPSRSNNNQLIAKNNELRRNQNPLVPQNNNQLIDNKGRLVPRKNKLGIPNKKNSLVDKNKQLQDALDVLQEILQGKPYKQKVPSSTIAVITKLFSSDFNELALDAKQSWNNFRNTQTSIILNMAYMYKEYNGLRRLLFSEKATNLLKVDTIVKIFPRVKRIICTDMDKNGAKGYGDDIVNSMFFKQLYGILHDSEEKKQYKLQEIRINTHKPISDKHPLGVGPYGSLGWAIRKASGNTITLTAIPKGHDFVEPVSILSPLLIQHNPRRMLRENTRIKLLQQTLFVLDHIIRGRTLTQSGTRVYRAHVLIFRNLLSNSKYSPLYMKQIWDQFRNKQQTIEINMYYMYNEYWLFFSDLISLSTKNLLLLDKIVTVFPNVKKIICEDTDYDKDITNQSAEEQGLYLPSIVNSAFILALKNMLRKIGPHRTLKEITIKNLENKIQDDTVLYHKQFQALGWTIQKINEYDEDEEDGYETGQIYLTKALNASK